VGVVLCELPEDLFDEVDGGGVIFVEVVGGGSGLSEDFGGSGAFLFQGFRPKITSILYEKPLLTTFIFIDLFVAEC